MFVLKRKLTLCIFLVRWSLDHAANITTILPVECYVHSFPLPPTISNYLRSKSDISIFIFNFCVLLDPPLFSLANEFVLGSQQNPAAGVPRIEKNSLIPVAKSPFTISKTTQLHAHTIT